MSSIFANGATQSISLDMSGTSIAYTITGDSRQVINSWPVTITGIGAGSSSILNVKATQPLTISSSTGGTSGYFIAGSAYITFDGSGNTITINTITSYPGFIQNGTSSVNGKSNIAVQNFTTTISGGSTLATSAGWLCQSYFSRGVAGNTMTNCTNNGDMGSNFGVGGIVGGYAASSSGVMDISGCTNSGSVTGQNSGGIAGSDAGNTSGTLTFTNCTNSGSTASNGGGIAGSSCARNNATVTITSCTNTGTIGTDAGGIVGANAGQTSGRITINNCNNSGAIGSSGGGIAGSLLGFTSGIATITSCTNTGTISGSRSGGIVGDAAGRTNGKVTITNCYNVGNMDNINSGGIAGYNFARDSSQNCVVARCYNVGNNTNITNNNCGGILGGNPGYNTIAVTPLIDISSCYSIGALTASAGGILGGLDGATYTNNPTINITNCYGFDNATAANSRIIAPSYTKPTTQTNCYAATTGWSDATANAALTGTPTSLTSGNPGTTWTKVASGTTGNPYVLAAYNAALYSPSSATSSASSYTTSAGLFTDPSYNYQIVYTSQSGSTATTRVFVSKGTSPQYHSYNSNTFAITNNQRSLISTTITSSTGVLSYTFSDLPCFLEGTQILCLEHGQEVYRPIESLRKGDLVKTLRNGYLPIDMIGTTRICNPGNSYRTPNRLYKCSKEKYPDLFEDLYITGCHSILVQFLTEDQWNNTKGLFGVILVTDNKYRLMAWLDENAEPFNNDGYFSIYHIALENSDSYMNYGIYANGLLVETCSKRYLRELSGMRLLGEEDCTASQSMQVDNVFNKITNLIETC